MSFPKQKKPRSWRILQDWIRQYADQEELPQSRVRRAVSFMLVALPLDRSLDEEGDPLFLVTGGVSMELRLKMRARTTKDPDMVYRGTFEHWLDSLDEALVEEIDDFCCARDESVQIRGTGASWAHPRRRLTPPAARMPMAVALADMPDRQQSYAAMVERMSYLSPPPEHWTELIDGVIDFTDPLLADEGERFSHWDPEQSPA